MWPARRPGRRLRAPQTAHSLEELGLVGQAVDVPSPRRPTARGRAARPKPPSPPPPEPPAAEEGSLAALQQLDVGDLGQRLADMRSPLRAPAPELRARSRVQPSPSAPALAAPRAPWLLPVSALSPVPASEEEPSPVPLSVPEEEPSPVSGEEPSPVSGEEPSPMAVPEPEPSPSPEQDPEHDPEQDPEQDPEREPEQDLEQDQKAHDDRALAILAGRHRDRRSSLVARPTRRGSALFPRTRRRASLTAIAPPGASAEAALSAAAEAAEARRASVRAAQPADAPITPRDLIGDALRSGAATRGAKKPKAKAKPQPRPQPDPQPDRGAPSPFVEADELRALRASAREPRPGVSERERAFDLYRAMPEWRGDHIPDRPPSSISLFLANCDALQLPPSTMAILPKVPAEVDLSHNGFGDSYCCALSSTLAFRPEVRRLNLRENRLTPQSIAAILPQLHHNLTALDLSANAVGLDGARLLAEFLARSVSLKELQLAGASLTDVAGEALCAALQLNSALTALDVSRNELGPRSMAPLAAALSGGRCALTRLTLAWNAVRGAAAERLAAGLLENSLLESLDVSWNALGSSAAGVRGLAAALELHPRLRHLDLSHNRLDADACRQLAAALRDNHVLLGLHVDGAPAAVDAHGHLQVSPNATSAGAGCWVCDRWAAVVITWYVGRSGDMGHRMSADGAPEKVYVHCSFDGWAPRLLRASMVKAGRLQATVAAPPGPLRYVFSNGEGMVLCSADNITSPLVPPATLQGQRVAQANVMRVRAAADQRALHNARPRASLSEPVAARAGAWSFARSVFSTFRQDSDAKLAACLNADWLHTKCDRFVPADELDETKFALRQHYAELREIFRCYAAMSNSMDVFTMGLNAFSELMQRCNVVEPDVCNVTDLDTIFISSKISSARGTDRSLCRYQFVEAVVRTAVAKFVKSARVDSVPEAVHRLMREHLLPHAERFSANEFRLSRLYRAEVDSLLRDKGARLRQVFADFASKKRPASEPELSVGEFFKVLERSGLLLDERLSSREAKFAFVLSLQTVADEIDAAAAHTVMEFVEFLEALGRVADMRSKRAGSDLHAELASVVESVINYRDYKPVDAGAKPSVPKTPRRIPRRAAQDPGAAVGVFVRRAADLVAKEGASAEEIMTMGSVWG